MIKYKIYKILRFLHLISKEKFRKKTAKYTKEYRLIAASRLFDKDWYLEQNPDVKSDPIEHYLKKGWKEHRACTLYFNGDEYLKMNADVATANMNPLVHYLLHGKSEGRCAEVVVPSLLSVMIKKSRYTLRAIKKSLSETKKIVRTKPKKYEGKSADYILIAESEYFDKDWYLQNYPEVREAKVDPVDHYLMTGWKEGKNPGPEFDGNWYLKVHKDVARAKINPLRHYMKHRIDEKRISNICHDAPRTFMQILATCFINRQPKFSIIVASYNYQDYLKKTLDSLLKQDYPNYEIIVVDDGSSDNSVGVVKKYVKKSPRVFLYQHPGGSNRGLPETLFLGLSKATGDYIAFCESDDLWTPNHLSECVKLINKYARPEVIINDCECFGDPQDLVNKKQRYIVDRNHWMFQQNKRKFTFDEFRSNNYITTFSACMVKTSALKKCNFLTPRKAAIDWWLWRQLAFRYPIYFVNKRITEWRVHESYLEKSINEKKLFQQCFTKRMDSFLLDKNYFTRISSEDYKLIKNSKHFDWDYYKNTYGIRDGVDCVKHYYSYGWRRGFNPSLNFITNDYLLLNPEVISEDICPLLHYEKVGRSRWYRYTKNKIVDEAKIKQYWHDRKKYPTRKKVQYTCMTNGYDDLTVSDYIDPEWDYVLFTDNKKLLKQKHFYMWKCEPLKHVSADSVRTSRWHKTHPHILFPRYKYSLWCDSNQNFLTDHIYRLIDEHIKNNTLIAAYKHYCRDCLYEEAMECKTSRKDKIDVIDAQINSYVQDKFPAHNGLFETGLMFRQHKDKKVISVDEKWYEEIEKYSKRDQLSFTYALWKNEIQCEPFEASNLREIGNDVELFRHLGSNTLSKEEANSRPEFINYRNYDDLKNDILHNIQNINFPVDLIVAIPRSGVIPGYMLGAFLNKPVKTLDEFINQIRTSKGDRMSKDDENYKNVLVLDDSVNLGAALKRTKEKIGDLSKKYNIKYAAVYATELSKGLVDFYFTICPQPRVFEWNYLNSGYSPYMAYDIDGVLCKDPTDEQNDDGELYKEFLLNADPLYITKYEIGALVTSRLEKYRKETETWMKNHNVHYQKLYMLDLPSKEERIKQNAHTKIKSEIYMQRDDLILFIESSARQAEIIAKTTHKDVICVENGKLYTERK